MFPAQSKATVRMIVTSFAAGAGLMLFAGLAAPLALQGGLSIRDAWAATVEAKAPIIEPLDVAAIRAELAQAHDASEASRAATETAIARLDRLAAR